MGRFVRDLFSGEMKELPFEGSGVIFRIEPKCKADFRSTHSGYPFASYAMGMSPKDVPRAQAELAKHGVTTQYDKHGDPIMESPEHRKRHMRALGFCDRSAFGTSGEVVPLNW